MFMEKEAVTVTAAGVNLLDGVLVESFNVCNLLVQNTGANPFTLFQIISQLNADAPEMVLVGSGGFASPFVAPVNWSRNAAGAAVDPFTLAAGAQANISIDVTGLYSVTVYAKAALGSVASVYGSCN